MARFNFGGAQREWTPPLRDSRGRFISRNAYAAQKYGSNTSIIQRLNMLNEKYRIGNYQDFLSSRHNFSSAERIQAFYRSNYVMEQAGMPRWGSAERGYPGMGASPRQVSSMIQTPSFLNSPDFRFGAQILGGMAYTGSYFARLDQPNMDKGLMGAGAAWFGAKALDKVAYGSFINPAAKAGAFNFSWGQAEGMSRAGALYGGRSIAFRFGNAVTPMRALMVADAAVGTYNSMYASDPIARHQGQATQGAFAGAWAGGRIGAAAGSFIPGLGTLAGGIIGSIGGGIGGYMLGNQPLHQSEIAYMNAKADIGNYVTGRVGDYANQLQTNLNPMQKAASVWRTIGDLGMGALNPLVTGPSTLVGLQDRRGVSEIYGNMMAQYQSGTGMFQNDNPATGAARIAMFGFAGMFAGDGSVVQGGAGNLIDNRGLQHYVSEHLGKAYQTAVEQGYSKKDASAYQTAAYYVGGADQYQFRREHETALNKAWAEAKRPMITGNWGFLDGVRQTINTINTGQKVETYVKPLIKAYSQTTDIFRNTVNSYKMTSFKNGVKLAGGLKGDPIRFIGGAPSGKQGGGGGGYSAYQRQAQAHYAQMQARQAMFTRLQGYEADAGLEASRVVRAPQMPMRFDYHDMMGGLGSFDYDPKGYFDRLDSGYARNLAGIKTQYDFNVSGARQEALETKMPYLKELSRIKSDKNYNSSPEMKNAAKGVQEKINSIESYLNHKVKSWDLQLSEVKKDIGMTRENDYFNKAQQIASQFKQGVFNEKIQSIRDKKDFTNRRIGDLNFKLQNGMYKSGLFAAESGIREGLSMRGQAAEYDYQESLAYIQREEDQLSQMRFAAYDPRIPESQRKEILEHMNQMAPALKERRASAERMLKYEQGQATLSRSEVINLRAPIFQQLSSPYVKALMGGLQGKPVMPAVSNAFFGQMTQLANYGAGRWLAGMSQKLMPNGFQGLGLTSGVGVAAKEGTIASMLQHVAGGKFAYLGTQAGFMAGAGGMAAGMIGSQMLYPMLNENYNRSTGFMGSALGGIAGAAIGSMIAPGIGTVAGGAFLGSMAGGSLGLLGAGSGKFDSSIESRYYTRQPVSRMQRAMKSGAGGALTGALVGGIAAGLMTGGLGFFAGAAIGTVGGGLAGGGIGALFGGSSGKMGPLGRAAYQQNELLPFLQSTQMGIDPFSSGFKFSILSDRFLQAARGMQGHGSNGMAMKRAAMTNILGLMNSLQPFQANLEAPGGYKGLLFGASLQDQVMLSGQNPFTSDPFSQMFGFYRDMQSKLGEFGSDNGRLDLAKQAFSGYYGNMMTQLDRSISDGQRDLGFMQRGNSISALDRVLNLDIMNRNVSTFDRDTQIQIEGAMGTLQRRGNIPAIIQKLKDDRAFEKDVLLRKQDILQQSSSLEADQQGANYSDASRTIQEMLGSRDLLTQKFNELLPEIGSTTDLFVKLNQEIRTITESMERFNSAIR
jgi:hypothetical protein